MDLIIGWKSLTSSHKWYWIQSNCKLKKSRWGEKKNYGYGKKWNFVKMLIYQNKQGKNREIPKETTVLMVKEILPYIVKMTAWLDDTVVTELSGMFLYWSNSSVKLALFNCLDLSISHVSTFPVGQPTAEEGSKSFHWSESNQHCEAQSSTTSPVLSRMSS